MNLVTLHGWRLQQATAYCNRFSTGLVITSYNMAETVTKTFSENKLEYGE
jgi:hypothetical protein